MKALILDYGGVICFHPTEEQIAAAARACDTTPEAFLDAFWKHRIPYDAGQDPFDYWHAVGASLGKLFEDSLIVEMIDREIDFWMKWDERVLSGARELRAKGVKIAILSNLPRPLGTRLRNNAQFMDHFDFATLSFELGIVKPQREIYEHCVRGLGVEAGDALFLDDRPENVDGAVAAGLQARFYRDFEDFRL